MIPTGRACKTILNEVKKRGEGVILLYSFLIIKQKNGSKLNSMPLTSKNVRLVCNPVQGIICAAEKFLP